MLESKKAFVRNYRGSVKWLVVRTLVVNGMMVPSTGTWLSPVSRNLGPTFVNTIKEGRPARRLGKRPLRGCWTGWDLLSSPVKQSLILSYAAYTGCCVAPYL